MTSETGVENEQSAPIDPNTYPSFEDLEKQVDALGGQIAELIKDRDKHRDKVEVLERTAVLMTSLLAEAEVSRLEAKLELAKERSRQARKLVRDGKPFGGVIAIGIPDVDAPNGKDA